MRLCDVLRVIAAYTHLLTEGIAASMQRNVSPSHPIYKLLAPHLVHLLSINSVSLNKLLEPNGWVDSCMSIGRDGVKELIKRGCVSVPSSVL